MKRFDSPDKRSKEDVKSGGRGKPGSGRGRGGHNGREPESSDLFSVVVERGGHSDELKREIEEWSSNGGKLNPRFFLIPPTEALVCYLNLFFKTN